MSNPISNYYRNIPANTFQEAVNTGAIAFLCSTILSNNLAYGVTKGCLNFVATLVHGAVSPLFQSLLNKNKYGENSYLLTLRTYNFLK